MELVHEAQQQTLGPVVEWLLVACTFAFLVFGIVRGIRIGDVLSVAKLDADETRLRGASPELLGRDARSDGVCAH